MADRPRLGSLLVDENIITDEQLQEALRVQQETGEMLGNVLVQRGFVEENRLLAVLARHYAGLKLTLEHCKIGQDVINLLPASMAAEFMAMPVSANEDRVILAMADPTDDRAVQALASHLRRRVWPVLCSREVLQRALAVHYATDIGETPATAQRAKLPALYPQPPPEFTFESFIVGDANRVAYLTAQEAAMSPGEAHNPLLIHGEAGLGKTHLLCAIGNSVLANDHTQQVAWYPAAGLERALVDAIEENEVDLFHARYERVDVLILDDIHFLARGRGVQEEFARLFEYLCSRGKQIAATSDRPLEELDVLVDDIRSHFSSGVTAEVHTPSVALKMAILMAKQKICGMMLSDDLILELARKLPDDIRYLEGTLRNLALRVGMSGDEPTVEGMRSVLEQMGVKF